MGIRRILTDAFNKVYNTIELKKNHVAFNNTINIRGRLFVSGGVLPLDPV